MEAPKPQNKSDDNPSAVCGGELSDCTRTVLQYADVCVPIRLKPNVTIDDVTAEICGEPSVECCRCKCGNGFEINVTQKIGVTIPISYRINVCAGDACISCRD